MSSTQVTVVPPTTLGPGVTLSIVSDNFTAGQLTMLITPPTGGAIMSAMVQPYTQGTDTLNVSNTLNSDGTLSLISGQIKATRTDTMNQGCQFTILSRG
jgi:hypothetical protein